MIIDELLLKELGDKAIQEQVKEYVNMFDNVIDFIKHNIGNDINHDLKGAIEYLQILEQDKLEELI